MSAVSKRSRAAKKARATHKAIQSTRAKSKILKQTKPKPLKITKREMRKIMQSSVNILPRNAMVTGDFGPPVSFAAVTAAIKTHKGPLAGRVHFGVTAAGKIIICPTVHDYAVHTGRRPPEDAA